MRMSPVAQFLSLSETEMASSAVRILLNFLLWLCLFHESAGQAVTTSTTLTSTVTSTSTVTATSTTIAITTTTITPTTTSVIVTTSTSTALATTSTSTALATVTATSTTTSTSTATATSLSTVLATSTAVTTTTSTATASTFTVCVSIVSTASTCGRKRRSYIDKPIILALDDEADRNFAKYYQASFPQPNLLVAPTAVPVQVRMDSSSAFTSGIFSPSADAIQPSFFHQQVLDGRHAEPFFYFSTVTTGVPSTQTVTVFTTSTSTFTQTVVLSCTPNRNNLAFSVCPSVG